MEIEVQRQDAQSWYPHTPQDASDIVVLVTDILFDHIAPDSGISPELAVRDVQDVISSEAGMAAYVQASTHADGASPANVVLQLADMLDAPSPDPRELISRLREVVESPLAVEIYDQEMERRRPRDASRWH